MKSKRIFIGVAALAITLGAPAVADNIYKWTDAEGNVHYEDRPSYGEADVERVAISNRRTDRGALQNRVQSQQDSQAAREDARNAREDEERSAAEKRAEAKSRKEKCENYRGQLETMVQSRRLYREDENGERTYLDDSEKQEAREHAEELIKEYCSS